MLLTDIRIAAKTLVQMQKNPFAAMANLIPGTRISYSSKSCVKARVRQYSSTGKCFLCRSGLCNQLWIWLEMLMEEITSAATLLKMMCTSPTLHGRTGSR